MPRPLRINVPNIPFHILDRGNNRQTVFRRLYSFFKTLKKIIRYEKNSFQQMR